MLAQTMRYMSAPRHGRNTVYYFQLLIQFQPEPDRTRCIFIQRRYTKLDRCHYIGPGRDRWGLRPLWLSHLARHRRSCTFCCGFPNWSERNTLDQRPHKILRTGTGLIPGGFLCVTYGNRLPDAWWMRKIRYGLTAKKWRSPLSNRHSARIVVKHLFLAS